MDARMVKKLGVVCIFVSIVLAVPFSLLLKTSFSDHMTLHMILAYALAPSLLIAGFFIWLLPVGWQNRISTSVRSHKRILAFLAEPAVGLVLSTFAMWTIHNPYVYDLAMGNDLLHAIIHLALVGSFVLYWAPFFNSGYGLPSIGTNESRVLYLLAGATVSGLLGALIIFSNSVIYGHHFMTQDMGLIRLSDQQSGGAIMWIAGCFAYAVAALLTIRNRSVNS